MNTPRRHRRRVLELAAGIPGVTDVEAVRLRIAPGRAGAVFCRYDVPPHAAVSGDPADPAVLDWLLGLLGEAGVGAECFVWFAIPDGRWRESTPGDAWIRLVSADGNRSVVELWKALPCRDLLVVDAAQERVLGISEQEYETLGHLMTVEELVAWPGRPV